MSHSKPVQSTRLLQEDLAFFFAGRAAWGYAPPHYRLLVQLLAKACTVDCAIPAQWLGTIATSLLAADVKISSEGRLFLTVRVYGMAWQRAAAREGQTYRMHVTLASTAAHAILTRSCNRFVTCCCSLSFLLFASVQEGPTQWQLSVMSSAGGKTRVRSFLLEHVLPLLNAKVVQLDDALRNGPARSSAGAAARGRGSIMSPGAGRGRGQVTNPGLLPRDGASGHAAAGAGRNDARARARYYATTGTPQGTYRLLQANAGTLLLIPDELSQSWVGLEMFSTMMSEHRAALVSLANGGDLNQTFANATEVRLDKTHMCLITGIQVHCCVLKGFDDCSQL